MHEVGWACGTRQRSGTMGNRARGWPMAVAYDRWGSALAILRAVRQQVALGPRDGAGEEHRSEVPYQLTRWSNTYSGAGAGVSSQWDWAACSHSGGPRAGATSGAAVGSRR